MSAASLVIEVSPRNVSALRAAWALRSNPGLNASIRAIDAPHALPSGRVLRIESGSRVEPMLTLLYGAERAVDDDEHQRAVRVGLNAAVFTTGRPGYEWSDRGRMLPARACLGIPDSSRPWVLVAPGVRVDERVREQLARLSNPQLHFLGPSTHSRSFSGVWWLPTPKVVLSLLGRVSAVLSAPGPLAWDAARLGVPVIEASRTWPLSAHVVDRRLAHIVPATLASHASFWKVLGAQLAETEATGEWGTIAWLLRAREGSALPATTFIDGARFKRKLLKLRRSPASFWDDSALKRYLGERSRRDNSTQRS